MRSQFADKFNHDADAPGYDAEVQNEVDPIRAGYAELLGWVAAQALLDQDSAVLELGCGTGNLASRLLPRRHLVCVDVSREMTRIAQGKLATAASLGAITWVLSDLLEFFDQPRGPFDAVVSTYTVHHLTEVEKGALFRAIREVLVPGGRAAFGDLMFENARARRLYLDACRACGQEELAEEIEDEFFWDVEVATRDLRGYGFAVTAQRFSELSWGIAASG